MSAQTLVVLRFLHLAISKYPVTGWDNWEINQSGFTLTKQAVPGFSRGFLAADLLFDLSRIGRAILEFGDCLSVP